MQLSEIRQGMEVRLTDIAACKLKDRMLQFGLVDGMSVVCRMERKNIVALQWPGTMVAVRRKDLTGMNGQVVVWIH